jgi:hypothetical protein
VLLALPPNSTVVAKLARLPARAELASTSSARAA